MAATRKDQDTVDGKRTSARSVRLMTASDVAEALQVSEGTLRNWRSAKRGPRFAKVGGSVRYRETDIVTWIEDNLETVY